MQMLSPKEALNMWNEISQTLDESIPVNLRSPGFFIDQLRQNVSNGTVICWSRHDGDNLATITVTTIIDDYLLKTRNLCIFAAKNFIPSTFDLRKDMFNCLANYGAKMGCRNIIAYSNNDKISEYAAEMNANKQSVYCFNIIDWWTNKENTDASKNS